MKKLLTITRLLQVIAPILRREKRKGQSAALGVAFSFPITIDTTNAEDNKKFILKIEKQLKSSNYPNKRRYRNADLGHYINNAQIRAPVVERRTILPAA